MSNKNIDISSDGAEKEKFSNSAPLGKEQRDEKSDRVTATEILAFFAGVAVIISLTSSLFMQPFFERSPFIIGLSFSQDALFFNRKFMMGVSFLIPITIILAFACDYCYTNLKSGAEEISKLGKVFAISFRMFLLVFHIAIFSFFLCIEKEVTFFMLVTLLLLLIIATYLKCTIACRAMLFVLFFMMSFWVIGYHSSNYYKGDFVPVVIKFKDVSKPKAALNCIISKEGFAFIKYDYDDFSMVPISNIIEIKNVDMNVNPEEIDNADVINSMRKKEMEPRENNR